MGPIDDSMMAAPVIPSIPTEPEAPQLVEPDTQPNTQAPYASVAEVSLADEVQRSATPQLFPDIQNYATDEDTYNFCQNEVRSIIRRIKMRRKPLEDEWLAIQRLRTLTHDGGQKYKGRSNVYMPTYATAHNTIVSQLSRGLFPSDDYMDVYAKDINREQEATAVKDAIKYEFECNAKIKVQTKPMLSQVVDHGNGVVKYWFRTGKEFKGRKQNKQFSFTPIHQSGLTVSARSIFNVVVFPETASDEKEVQLTAEYITVSQEYAKALGASDRWLNMDKALAAGATNSEEQTARDQTLNDVAKIPGITEDVDGTDARENGPAKLLTVIECYCSIKLPKSAYVEGEDSSRPVPARIVFLGDIPVSVTRNPFYHQKHPYKWYRVNVVPGSFYGSWCGRRARYLQYLINDFANQTNDAGIYSLNPMWAMDTNLMVGPILPVAPGRIYRVRGDLKNALQPIRPEGAHIQYGNQLLNLYISALMDNTGAPPVLQGVGRSEETATGQSILQRNSLQPLQDVVEDGEAQVFAPLMEDCWALIVQYSDKEVLINGKAIALSDLDEFFYDFKFIASSQVANQQARATQATAFLQALVPMIPLMLQQGQVINPTPVLKRLYTDLGLRQFDEFVYPVQQNPLMMQQLMSQQAQGAPSNNDTGNSQQNMPMPTVPNGPENNAPIPGMGLGEAPAQATDDFDVTRTIADEMAAMAGRAGGPIG